ncbi:MAG: DUF2207 domain-containing protein [Rhodococcus sp.]|nr:DUF2207 domain-containing protein [Rhodococcus sp. (in: high G+C Gram-positive bacteria)]
MVQLAIAAVVLGLVHYLLHRRLVRATGVHGRSALTIDVVLGLGWVMALVAVGVGTVIPPAGIRPVGFVGMTWLAAVFYLLLGLAAIGIGLAALRLAGRAWGRPTPAGRRRFLQIVTAGMDLNAGAQGWASWWMRGDSSAWWRAWRSLVVLTRNVRYRVRRVDVT